jgi:hypothetical protein
MQLTRHHLAARKNNCCTVIIAALDAQRTDRYRANQHNETNHLQHDFKNMHLLTSEEPIIDFVK